MSGPLDNKRRGKGMFLALEPRILLDAAAAVLAGDLIQEALTADSDAGTVERAQVEPTADAEDATTDSPETQADTYDTADSADAAASPLDAAAEVHPLDIVPAADGSADARHEIAFVDASVPEADSLVSGLPDRVEVYRIDAGSSGIAQITEILNTRTDIDAVHILSHGTSGSLRIGSDTLSTDTIDFYASQLTAIGRSLSADGDILLYGCDIGQDSDFVLRFSQITGADVAASTDDTGSAALGGDWELEHEVGTIDADAIVSDVYSGILGDNAPAVGSGQALDFDGVDDKVVVADSSALDLSSSFTIEAWIMPQGSGSSSTDGGMILNKEYSYEITRRQDGSIYYALNDDDTSSDWAWVDTGLDAPVDQWSHLAFIKSGTSLKVILTSEAGVSSTYAPDTFAGQPEPTTEPLTIGGRPAGNSSAGTYFNGLIDEVRIWSDARTDTEITTSLYTRLSGTEQGLVGSWDFEEPSGTTAYDRSPSANNGTLTNFVSTDRTSESAPVSERAGALVLDGTDDYLRVENHSELEITGDVTVAVWAKFDVLDGWDIMAIQGNGEGADNTLYMFGVSTSDGSSKLVAYWEYDSGGSDYYAYSTVYVTVNTSDWHHYAMVRDSVARTVSFYIDGDKFGDAVSYTNNAYKSETGPLTIGASTTSTGAHNFIDGKIDDLRIYSRALSGAEIAASKDTELNGSESGLVAYYSFNDAGGSVVVDSSPSRLNGTLYGGASLTTAASPVQRATGMGLVFDGTDDYVNAGANAALQITGDLTVETWANFESLDHNSAPSTLVLQGLGNIDNTQSSNNILYLFRINTDKTLNVFWEYGTGTNVTLTSTIAASVNAGEWHHYSFVRDAANKTLTFLVDGVKLGEAISYSSNPVGGDSTPLIIGAEYQDSGAVVSEFKGMIDDVRIWNVARSAADIAAAMSSRLPGTTANLVANFRLDEQGSSTIKSSNGTYTGTLSGNPQFVTNYYIDTLVTDQGTGILPSYDVDTSGTLTFSTTRAPLKGTLTWTDAAAGAFTYTPNAAATGIDTFFYEVSDGSLTSAPREVLVSILDGNQALDFDGVDDYVDLGINQTTLGNTFTISAWVNPDGEWTNYRGIAGDHYDSLESGGTAGIFFGQYNSDDPSTDPAGAGIVFSIGTGVEQVWSSVRIDTSLIPANDWSHVSMVVSADATTADNYIKVYVNGLLVGEKTGVAAFTPKDGFTIGRAYDRVERYFDGQIDEFQIWDTARSEAEIREYMYRELPDMVVSGGDLVAYYRFNESSGTLLYDARGGADGTLLNMDDADRVTSAAQFGPKNALDFDGTNDYVNLGSFTDFYGSNYDSDYTISAWVKPADTALNQSIFYARENTADEKYLDLCVNSDGTLTFIVRTIYSDTQGSVTSTVRVDDGRWHNVTAVKSGSVHTLYIDGVSAGMFTLGENPMQLDYFYIGASRTDSNNIAQFFNGRIDEFRLWDKALSASELRDTMMRSLTGNESGLAAYYNFDNSSGSVLQDFSGGGHDGTLVNMDSVTDWVASVAFNTWLNTSSTAWAMATNWSLGSVPVSTDNVGIYSYAGSSSPTLSSAATVNNFLLGTGATFTLSASLTVNGSLILENDLDLNGQVITLGGSAMLVEDGGRAYGTSGSITTTRTLSNISGVDVAGLGAEITTVADMGSTIITRTHVADTEPVTLKRSYTLTPITNTGLNATLVFHYDDQELNGLSESDLKLYTSTDSGSTWMFIGGTVDATANTVTLAGLGSLSLVTLGVNAPAVTASAGTTAFTESASASSSADAKKIDEGITVSARSGEILTGATVSITGNFKSGEDILAFANDSSTMGDLTGSYDSATGVLTLSSSGGVTAAQMQAALRAVTYRNTSETPTESTRTVSFVVNDGSVGSVVVTKLVSVAATNDAPVAGADSAAVSEDATGTGNVFLNDTDRDFQTTGITVNNGSTTNQGLVFDERPAGTTLLGGATSLDISIIFSSTDSSGDTPIFSYAAGSSYNELLFDANYSNSGKLDWWFGGTQYSDSGITCAELFDGLAHTLRFTWISATGATAFYLDGVQKSLTTHFTNSSLGSDGVLVLGQEQDSVGGGWSTSQVFSGTYYGVSITAGDGTTTRTAHWDMSGAQDGTVTSESGGYDLTLAGSPTLVNQLSVSAIRTGTEAGSGTSGTVGQSLAGTYGTLTINADGSYSYSADQNAADALAAGSSATDTFTYSVSDGGLTDTAELVFTVNGMNDVPLISSVSAGGVADMANSSTLGLTSGLSGQLSGTDIDAGAALTYGISSGTTGGSYASGSVTYDVSRPGSYGTLYLASASGMYLYVPTAGYVDALPAGAAPSDSFTVSVSDGSLTATQTYTVNFTGANDPLFLYPDSDLIQEASSTGIALKNADGTAVSDLAIRGIATDGTYMYIADDNGASSLTIVRFTMEGTMVDTREVAELPVGWNQMVYLDGAIYFRSYNVNSASNNGLYRIATSNWSTAAVSSVTVPGDHPLLIGDGWMNGNLFTTPDGRIGVLGQQDENYDTLVRLYSVSDDGLTLTHVQDITIYDTVEFPEDSHGAASDGQYLYVMSMNAGYRVYSLIDGSFVYDNSSVAEGGSWWTMQTPVLGDTAKISNATYLTRNPLTGAFIWADYDNARVVSSAGVVPSFTVTEDVAGNLTFTGTPFADIDGDTLTVTLSVADGTIAGSAVTGITIGGNGTARTFAGSAADLNTYFGTAGKITYTAAQDSTASRALTVSVTDGTLSSSLQAVIAVTAVNDVPTNTVGTSSFTVNEDTSLSITGLSVADVDETGNLSVELTASHGTVTILADVGGGLVSSGISNNGSGSVRLSGTAAAINATLAATGGVSYKGTLNYNGSDALTIKTTDSGTAYDSDSVLITVNSVDDAATIGGNTSGSGAEDGGAITGTLTATDAADGLTDGAYFSVSGAAPHGTATINASTGAWSYTPTANYNGSDSFTVTVIDDDGFAKTQQISLTVTPVPDTVSVTNASTDEDTQTVSGLVISRNAADGSETEYFKITEISGGTLYKNDGTTAISNGTFITYAEGNAGLKFTPSANSTSNGTFQVQGSTTNSEGGLGGSAVAASITVAQVNDAPAVTAGGTTAFTEQTPIAVASAITLSDAEGDGEWTGGTLKVQVTANSEATDSLVLPNNTPEGDGIWLDEVNNKTLKYGSTAIGTASSFLASGDTAWTFTFNATATNALVQATARAIQFNNSSDTPGTASRTVTFTATDMHSAATSATQAVTVAALNDAPKVTNEADPALVFDGTDDYALFPDIDANISTAFTLETWVKFDDLDGVQFISGKGTEQMELHTSGSALRFIPTNGAYIDTGSVLVVDTWTHIAATYDAGADTAHIYINGVEVSAVDTNAAADSALLATETGYYLGSRAHNTYYLNGSIADFRIWNDVRTADEIRINMNAELQGSEAGLVALWNLDEGSGTTLADATSSRFNGTAYSTTTWTTRPVTVGLSVNYTEDASPVSLFSGVNVSTVETGETITAMTLTVSNVSDATESLGIDSSAVALTNGASGTTATNELGYSVSVSSGTATVTLSKAAGISASATETLINGITYSNSCQAPSTGATRTVTITSLKDSGGSAGGGSDTASLNVAATVTVHAVNDAPTVVAGGTTAFTEQTPIAVASTISISDADGDADWNGGTLTVQITASSESSDSLSLPTSNPGSNGIWMDGTNVMFGTTVIGAASVSYVSNGTAWMITFNGNATNALVQATAQAILFNNSSDAPGISARTVTFIAADKSSGAASATQSVMVTALNDAPAFTQSGAVSSSPDQSTMALKVEQYTGYQSNVLANLVTYASQHTANYTVTADVIDYTDDTAGFAGSIPGSYRWPAAVATNYSGTGGINDKFFARISGAFYVNTGDDYTFRTYSDDGVFLIVDGNTSSLVINDSGYHAEKVNEGTVHLNAGTHTLELYFFENGGEASLEFTVKSSTSAYGHIGSTNPLFSKPSTYDTGTIGFGDADGIVDDGDHKVSVTPATDALGTLSASVTKSSTAGTGGEIIWSYTVNEDAIRYLDDNETKIESYTITLDDDHGGVVDKVVNITITGVNDAPALSTVGTLTGGTEDTAYTISYSDLAGAANDADVDGDTLSFRIESVTRGTLTKEGTAVTPGTTLLSAGESLVWMPDSNANGTLGAFAVRAWDGTVASSNAVQVSVTVGAVNDAPTVTAGNQSPSFTEIDGADTGAHAVVVNSALLVSDVDSVVSGATVTITNVQSGDVLLFTDTAKIQGIYSSGVLTLSPKTGQSPTTADFEAALESVTFSNTGDSPDTTARTIEFRVTDDTESSVAAVESVSVAAVNDTPVISVGDVAGAITEGTTLSDSGSITFADLDLTDSPVASEATLSVSALKADGTTVLTLTDAQKSAIEAAFSITNVEGNTNNGEVTWSYSIAETALDFLAAGENVTAVFTITVNDKNGGTDTEDMTITITGTNDVPTVTNAGTALVGLVVESGHADDGTVANGMATVTGTLTSSDVDTGASKAWSLQGTPSTTYGTMVLDATSGVWTYTLDNTLTATQALKEGESATQTYTARVTDDKGAYVDQTVTVTITGTNDVPTVTNAGTALVGSVIESGNADDGTAVAGTATASGTLSSSDVDASATATWSLQGTPSITYGTMVLDATSGVWTYTLDNTLTATQALKEGESATQSYTARVTDDKGAYVDQTVTITITGTNDAPVLQAVTAGSITETGQSSATADQNLSGTLTAADVDGGDSKTYGINDGSGNAIAASDGVVSKAGTYGTLTLYSSTGVYAYTKNASAIEALDYGESGSDSFTLTVKDGAGAVSMQTYTVSVTGHDDAPTLSAVTSGSITETDLATVVTETGLTGTLNGSDVDVETLAYGIDMSGTGSLAGLVTRAGSYGTLYVNPGTGQYEYVRLSGAVEALAASETASDSFTVSVYDGDGSLVTQTFTVNLTGADDAPSITVVDIDGSITEGSGDLAESGSITFGDVDFNDRPTATKALKSLIWESASGITLTDTMTVGRYNALGGAFSIAAASANSNGGSVAWTYQAGETDLDFLAAGEKVTAVYTITVADGKGGSAAQDVTVTITGTNDAPSITEATVTGSITEGSGDLTETGSIAFADVDLADRPAVTKVLKSLKWESVSGADGRRELTDEMKVGQRNALVNAFEISERTGNSNNGAVDWLYSVSEADLDFLAEGERVTAIYTITVSDDRGGSASKDVMVTITGTNDAPTLSEVVSGSIIEDPSATTVKEAGLFGSLRGSDADNAPTLVYGIDGLAATGGTVTETGRYGTLRVNTESGVYLYQRNVTAVEALDEGQIVTDSFVFTVTDELSLQATSVFRVLLQGSGEFIPLIPLEKPSTVRSAENVSSILTDVPAVADQQPASDSGPPVVGSTALVIQGVDVSVDPFGDTGSSKQSLASSVQNAVVETVAFPESVQGPEQQRAESLTAQMDTKEESVIEVDMREKGAYRIPESIQSLSQEASSQFIYEASLLDGSPLPEGVRFDALTQSFVVTGKLYGDIEIVVRARDGSGNETKTVYRLEFGSEDGESGNEQDGLQVEKLQGAAGRRLPDADIPFTRMGRAALSEQLAEAGRWGLFRQRHQLLAQLEALENPEAVDA